MLSLLQPDAFCYTLSDSTNNCKGVGCYRSSMHYQRRMKLARRCEHIHSQRYLNNLLDAKLLIEVTFLRVQYDDRGCHDSIATSLRWSLLIVRGQDSKDL
jgi:hypothetical protein